MTFLCFAPIALWPSNGWITPGISAVIAFLLLGSENIAIQIEQPFKVILGL